MSNFQRGIRMLLSVHQRKFFLWGATTIISLLGLLYFRAKKASIVKGKVSIVIEKEQDMFFIDGKKIVTPYGTFDVQEQVIFDVIQSAAFQRIRRVHQYGVMKFVKNSPEYSRYTHCLGVWAILRKFGAPLNEQLAGLLHDVSHTVFSHLGDHIFNHKSDRNSYQDDIHEWFLRRYNIDRILAKYDIPLGEVLHKKGSFAMLERDLPDLCADRIEYNLRGGVVEGLITFDEARIILDALRFERGEWFFLDKDAAVKFAKIPLFLTVHEWGSAGNHLVYSLVASAIRRALELQVITFDEIHFSTDDIIWERLMNATDSVIRQNIDRALNFKSLYEVLDNAAAADTVFNVKFRGVNPLVLTLQGTLKRLTDIDHEFAKDYDAVAFKVKQGWAVKFSANQLKALFT